ncbi:benzoylformate decarboxylase [Salininema proteolyticum]|uniref:Benzoylformate decarboxylase n=1 Tax=Salininema proteolyticum TaxID=1607685 RepID=A0ABV8U225_9ACTN
MAEMTVRQACFEVLRAFGIDRVFGNPGSTELSFLREFPEDFEYVLGLQEAVVVGMADAHAALTRRPSVVSLHTAAGVGNAMGALTNARDNKTPILVVAGQQHREMLVAEPMLANPDATLLPRPSVKWSHESARAQDVPTDFAKALTAAMTPPFGPVFLSTPMDDFDAVLGGDDLARLDSVLARRADLRPVVAEDRLDAIAERLDSARNPALVFGGEVDWDESVSAAVRLAEATGAPVWSAPVEGRLCFPNDHPLYRGALEPATGLIAETLSPHDLVLVAGAPVFKYYPYVPGPWLAPATDLLHLTSSPREAATAVAGSSWVGHVGQALESLSKKVQTHREEPEPRPGPQRSEPADPLLPETVFATVAPLAPDDAVWVNESPSNNPQFLDQVRLSRPSSFFTAAGGGLGYGMAAAVGASLAAPSRKVVAVIGDGSAQYAVPAFWTARQWDADVVFLVLRNEEYAILKWFAQFEETPAVPGLDVGGLDIAAIASGYGIPAVTARSADEVAEAFSEAVGASGPSLIEVPITTVFPTLGGQ